LCSVRSLQFRAWFRTMLGEAYLQNGQNEKASSVIETGLSMSETSDFKLGVGLSRRVLGRIARATGRVADARGSFDEAAEIFRSTEAQFELAQTYFDCADVAKSQAQNLDAKKYAASGQKILKDMESAKV
jgi:uncharacterized protein HemY